MIGLIDSTIDDREIDEAKKQLQFWKKELHLLVRRGKSYIKTLNWLQNDLIELKSQCEILLINTFQTESSFIYNKDKNNVSSLIIFPFESILNNQIKNCDQLQSIYQNKKIQYDACNTKIKEIENKLTELENNTSNNNDSNNNSNTKFFQNKINKAIANQQRKKIDGLTIQLHMLKNQDLPKLQLEFDDSKKEFLVLLNLYIHYSY